MKNYIIGLVIMCQASTLFPALKVPSQKKLESKMLKRFEYFIDLTNKDSVQCCLRDFARLARQSRRIDEQYVSDMVRLSQASDLGELLYSLDKHFDELPKLIQVRLRMLIENQALSSIVEKRFASNGRINCKEVSKKFKL